ncbi:MAG TPA: 2,3-bisphosphoglycerate-independent phosphoglycerate mutase [Gemmatimonadales bacterium]|jgi:2,3-bisphosphoglycerate-independent phosphoglycerate mutase|nr:2,3-bisphosphoglycerate-independent phosphoglycerate mutase [Gemmatimonadales bacterium]
MTKSRGARTPVVLIVLDGWGFRPGREGNAIELGSTPTWHRLWDGAPRTLLEASGLAVGLPEGQIGNSEVGHLNLGAGRVVPQDIVRISQAIASGEFFRVPALVELCEHVRRQGATLHVIGLIGTGGVHALDTHLLAAVELGRRHGLPVAIHAWLDGRDTAPKSGLGFMEELVRTVGRPDGRTVVSTVVGRYYAMDRDKRWDRTKLAYDAMVKGIGAPAPDPISAITQAYEAGETDEFVKPRVITGTPRIRDGDGVFCFNFRADRMRQIVRALAVDGFDGFDVRDRPRVRLVTMTQYDATFPLPMAFGPMTLHKIVAEVLAERGKTMFRTAETEKYAHVTYFFNGGLEAPYKGEERLLVPSQKVATYDLMPQMSAPEVTDVLCRAIEAKQHDFVLCNYANGDMVGHSGVLAAAVQAVETVDTCLARVLATADQAGATVLVTADHGNCELMIDPTTGGPHTAHTTNPVPFLIVGDDGPPPRELRPGGSLRDVGPTILHLLGIEPPSEMTGRDLRETP